DKLTREEAIMGVGSIIALIDFIKSNPNLTVQHVANIHKTLQTLITSGLTDDQLNESSEDKGALKQAKQLYQSHLRPMVVEISATLKEDNFDASMADALIIARDMIAAMHTTIVTTAEKNDMSFASIADKPLSHMPALGRGKHSLNAKVEGAVIQALIKHMNPELFKTHDLEA
ncbi:MAG: hypothetical protein WAX89_05095, partial [Alphaproteobacteria bacterium]